MAAMTKGEIVEALDVGRGGRVMGYHRDASGSIEGPRVMDCYRMGGELVPEHPVLAEIYEPTGEVTELVGWPHARVAETVDGRMLYALRA